MLAGDIHLMVRIHDYPFIDPFSQEVEKGKFISTDIRYRNSLALADADSNVQVTVDNSAMDVSGANSAIGDEDVGNLYETLDKIVEGAKGVTAFVPEEDLSLSDLMGLIGEGGEDNKVELEVAGGDLGDVKSEYGDKSDSAETPHGGEAAKDRVPPVDCGGVNDSVITIDNPVEVVKTTESPSASVSVNDSVSGGAKSASESGCSGATVSPILTIPKYRLREIFRYANGNSYKLLCFYPIIKVRGNAGFVRVIAVLLSI